MNSLLSRSGYSSGHCGVGGGGLFRVGGDKEAKCPYLTAKQLSPVLASVVCKRVRSAYLSVLVCYHACGRAHNFFGAACGGCTTIVAGGFWLKKNLNAATSRS